MTPSMLAFSDDACFRLNFLHLFDVCDQYVNNDEWWFKTFISFPSEFINYLPC